MLNNLIAFLWLTVFETWERAKAARQLMAELTAACNPMFAIFCAGDFCGSHWARTVSSFIYVGL
jgi:hypothetical protein